MDIETNAYIMIYLFALIGLIYAALCAYKVSETVVRPVTINLDEDDENKKIVLSNDNADKLKLISTKIANGADIFLLKEYLILTVFIVIFAILIVFLAEKKLGFFYTTIGFIIGAETSLLAGYIGMKIATSTNLRTTFKAYYGMGEAFQVAYTGGCVMGFFLVSASIFVLATLIIIYKAIHFGDIVTQDSWNTLFEGIAGYGLGGSSVALFCRVGGGIYTKAADVGADLVAKLDMNLEEDDHRNPACIADNVGDNVGDIAGMGSDLFGSMAESLCAALLVGGTSTELTSTGGYLYPILISASGIIVCIVVTYVGLAVSEDIKNYDELEWCIKVQLIMSTVLLIPTLLLITNYYLPNTYTVGDVGTISYKVGVTKELTAICPILGLISGLLIGISTEYYTSMSFSPVQELTEGCKEGAAINIILGLALGFLSNILPTLLIAVTLFGSFTIAGMYGIGLSALGMLSNLPICLAIDGYGPISDNAGGLASMCELDERVREITDKLDAAGNTTAAIGKGFAIGSACLCAFALFGAFLTKAHLVTVNFMSPLVMSGVLLGAMLPFLFSALTMTAVGSAAEMMVEAIKEDFTKNIENPEHEPDTDKCIEIATTNSLQMMILPGIIVIVSPLFIGLLFGATAVSGLLIGTIISGIQMAISSSNTGGAWDNCKKSIKNNGLKYKGIERLYVKRSDLKKIISKCEKANEKLLKDNDEKKNDVDIEANNQKIKISNEEVEYLSDLLVKMENLVKQKGGVPPESDATKSYRSLPSDIEGHEREKEERNLIKEFYRVDILRSRDRSSFRNAEKASIIGDTVGDPLKDTSGPSLNILIKLSSIISVVFCQFYIKTGYLEKYFVV